MTESMQESLAANLTRKVTIELDPNKVEYNLVYDMVVLRSFAKRHEAEVAYDIFTIELRESLLRALRNITSNGHK